MTMVEEIFDDGKEPTPEQVSMIKALMNGGIFKFSYKEDGTADIDVIPISNIQTDPPKDAQ
jgi:hypothetical protein